MAKYKTPNGYVEVDWNTYNGNPLITVHDEGDSGTDETTVSLVLDNYQTYKLALDLLSGIEVDDNRGSK